jgi:hypothetical protein
MEMASARTAGVSDPSWSVFAYHHDVIERLMETLADQGYLGSPEARR